MDKTQPRSDLVYTNGTPSSQLSTPVSTASQSSAVSTLNHHPEAAASSCCCCLKPIWTIFCSILKCIGRCLFPIFDCLAKCLCFCVLKKVRQEVVEEKQKQATLREKCRLESVKNNETLAENELEFEKELLNLEKERKYLEGARKELSEKQKQLKTNDGSTEVKISEQKAKLKQLEIDFYKKEASLSQEISDHMILKEKVRVARQEQEDILQRNFIALEKTSDSLNFL
jgi:hypothetical protein